MVAGPFLVLYLTFAKRNAFVIVGFLAYLFATRIIKGIMYFGYGDPRQPFRWIFYMPHFIIFQYFSAVFRIWALFTLSNRKWGNRNVKVSNKTGEIVFTDENGKRQKEDKEEKEEQKSDEADPEINEAVEIEVTDVDTDTVDKVEVVVIEDKPSHVLEEELSEVEVSGKRVHKF